MEIPVSQSSSAPIRRSDATPADPSAFITTTTQSPSSMSQSSTCSPAPLSDATQNVCSPGGEDGGPPSRGV
jgi:hypothetical protein